MDTLSLGRERALGVVPSVAVFEPPAAVPDEPDEKRRRVSNGLFKLALEAAKVEADFEYQYGYNRELVVDIAAANKRADAAEARCRVVQDERDSAVDGYAKQIRSLVDEGESMQKTIRRLSRPSRFWRSVAAVGWFLAAVAGGVISFEKISGEPVDVLLNSVILELSTSTN